MERYAGSTQQILAQLARLDLLIQVQVWRARQQHAGDPELPAFYISEEEVDGLLARPICAPAWSTMPLPPEMQQQVQEQLDRMAEELEERTAASLEEGMELRLVTLAQIFALPAFDLDVILLCLAPEIDRRYERLFAYLHDDVTRRRPTVDLALNLFLPDIEHKLALRERFAPGAPLLRHRLVQLGEDPRDQPFTLIGKTIQLEPRIARYLLGGDEIDEALRPYVTMSAAARPLDELRFPAAFAQQLQGLAAQAQHAGAQLMLYCQGTYGAGKQSAAAAFAQALGTGILVVDGRRAAAQPPEEFAGLAQLIEREARLQGALLYWEAFDLLAEEGKAPQLAALLELLESHPQTVFLAGATAWEPAGFLRESNFVRLAFPQPGQAERLAIWQAALAALPTELDVGVDLPALANKFQLSGGQIYDAAATARGLAYAREPHAPLVTEADLHRACRLQSNRKLAELAQAITPHYSWDDLVLPPDQMAQLREIYQQVQHRARVYEAWGFDRKLALGKGLNVLFAGPPGTGKTMAADVLAHTLGLDLYKIDLSGVVSKYIGETEKNLARIFAEAGSSNAILFFDEADALFGKRTAIKDAHDRYANVEISYLLQKMEEYAGVVILATNLRKNMDEAFVRRLHFSVEFALPGVGDRRRIWEQIWPQATPLAPDLDFEYLAQRIEVAGGNIRNIALAGAFLAAADGGVITMQHLIQATRREYQKIGKVVSSGEFGQYGPARSEAEKAIGNGHGAGTA